MKGTKQFTTKLLEATDGLIGSVTDMVLMAMYFTLASPGRHTSYDFDNLVEESKKFVENVNYKTIKNALYTLTQNGQLQRTSDRKFLKIEITQAGNKRIACLCPVYKEQRPWGRHMFLISYDIPVRANTKRAVLRNILIRNGCALLQASLWVTPYDPHSVIRDFNAVYNPAGTIFISKLGTDGAIGEETVRELVRRVYRLDNLAQRYNTFIQRYASAGRPLSLPQAAINYFAILKDDPQLPFALLPDNFPCKQANRIFKQIMNNN
jgi:DNA-binding transcriptional regulator PaaX